LPPRASPCSSRVIHRAFFGAEFPARTPVGAALADGIEVEIDAIVRLEAAQPEAGGG
jgi:enamine deaminase RidA (YjgF/YER057c/UK114 family)